MTSQWRFVMKTTNRVDMASDTSNKRQKLSSSSGSATGTSQSATQPDNAPATSVRLLRMLPFSSLTSGEILETPTDQLVTLRAQVLARKSELTSIEVSIGNELLYRHTLPLRKPRATATM